MILSKRMIPFLTTIPKSATRPIIPGNESGCRNMVRPTNTPMRESGIVTSTRAESLYESNRRTNVATMRSNPNIIATPSDATDFAFSSLAHP